jgi:hypothetical protein
MIRALWGWLSTNSAAVQAIASALSVVVGIVTIFVLGVTWRAIRRQARAAEEQTAASGALIEAAQQQTKATDEAAAAAKEQSRLVALQYEQSMAPLIVARRTIGGPARAFTMLQLTNVGSGAAFRVILVKGKVDLEGQNKSYQTIDSSPSTLGPGEEWEANFDPDADGFMTVLYRGSDRIDRYTIIGTKGGFWQEHWVRRGTQLIGL